MEAHEETIGGGPVFKSLEIQFQAHQNEGAKLASAIAEVLSTEEFQGMSARDISLTLEFLAASYK